MKKYMIALLAGLFVISGAMADEHGTTEGTAPAGEPGHETTDTHHEGKKAKKAAKKKAHKAKKAAAHQ